MRRELCLCQIKVYFHTQNSLYVYVYVTVYVCVGIKHEQIKYDTSKLAKSLSAIVFSTGEICFMVAKEK